MFADATYTVSLTPFIVIGVLTFAVGVFSGISIAKQRKKKKDK